MSNFIPLADAVQMAKDFRGQRERIIQPGLQGKNVLAQCETFDAAQVQQLLNKPGCAKIRIYYGLDSDTQVHAMLVAVDAEGRDILPAAITEETDVVLNNGERCPALCPPPSILNEP